MSLFPVVDILNPIVLLATGLCAGMLSGCFGPAANLMVVPFLNIFGLPLTWAGGINLGQSFGGSLVDILTGGMNKVAMRRVGLVVGIFGLPGIFAGRAFFLFLADRRADTTATNFLYLILLLVAAYSVFRQWRSFMRLGYFEDNPLPPFGMRWRHLLTPPGAMGLDFITVGRVASVGTLLGLATGFLGLGATVLAIPLFMYVLGLPAAIASSTSLISVAIINGAGMISFSSAGGMKPATVLLVLGAAILGNKIVALLPEEIKWGHSRLAFSMLLAMSATAIIFKELTWGTLAAKTTLTACFLLIGAMALITFKNTRTRYRGKTAKEEPVLQSTPS